MKGVVFKNWKKNKKTTLETIKNMYSHSGNNINIHLNTLKHTCYMSIQLIHIKNDIRTSNWQSQALVCLVRGEDVVNDKVSPVSFEYILIDIASQQSTQLWCCWPHRHILSCWIQNSSQQQFFSLQYFLYLIIVSWSPWYIENISIWSLETKLWKKKMDQILQMEIITSLKSVLD